MINLPKAVQKVAAHLISKRRNIMNAVDYLKTSQEICDKQDGCMGCPILKACTQEERNPEKAVELVERWIAENKKAPTEAGTSVPGASEINQLQNNPDWSNCQEPVDPVIPELIEMVYKIKELNKTAGVLDIGSNGYLRVQLGDEKFFELFSFGSCDDERHPEYDEYSATVQGVKFFCLVEKVAGHHDLG